MWLQVLFSHIKYIKSCFSKEEVSSGLFLRIKGGSDPAAAAAAAAARGEDTVSFLLQCYL